MTPQEIDDRYNKEMQKQIVELKEHIKYVNDKESRKLNSNALYAYFDKKSYTVDLSVGDSISSVEESMKEFKLETKKLKKNLYYHESLQAEGCGYDDDTSIDYISFVAEWYEPKKEDSYHFKNSAMSKTKEWIASEIREERKVPKGQYFMIDCKMLSLFKDGSIDYKTFCDITLANCKL